MRNDWINIELIFYNPFPRSYKTPLKIHGLVRDTDGDADGDAKYCGDGIITHPGNHCSPSQKCWPGLTILNKSNLIGLHTTLQRTLQWHGTVWPTTMA
jgi:hypothetical protein